MLINSVRIPYSLTECTDGFYGDGCQKECGKCADMTQCNHVNGNCLGDCQSGFKGENCSQGNVHVKKNVNEGFFFIPTD